MTEKLFLKKNSLPIYDFFFSFIMFRTILAPLASVQVIINFEINSALCAAYPCSEEFDLLVFHGKNLDNFTSHVIVLIIRLYIKWLGLVVHSTGTKNKGKESNSHWLRIYFVWSAMGSILFSPEFPKHQNPNYLSGLHRQKKAGFINNDEKASRFRW